LYSHVLVPLDGSKLDDYILPHIEAVARSGLVKRITLVRVVEAVKIPPIFVPTSGKYINLNIGLLDDLISEKITQAESYLKNVIVSMCDGSTEIRWQVLSAGGIAAAIVQYATRNGVGFIMMASHGRAGFRRWLWGSVSHQVQRSTNIPVCIMPLSDPAVSLDCVSNYLQQTGE
jgi:nucleotide-binding universal stress UspA family protein